MIPSGPVAATLIPTGAMPNLQLESKGYNELLNATYGMGRWTASYRGHLLAYHGGDINGVHSQVSCMPQHSIGVIVFTIGDHSAPLYNIVTYNVYERLLGLTQTPWCTRILKAANTAKKTNREGREKAGGERIINTKPSHPLDDYAGEYEDPAYGIFKVLLKGNVLWMDYHKILLPLNHFHYDRFDSPNDEQHGLWSLNFSTNPWGEVDRVTVSMDESDVTFARRTDATLADPKALRRYTGKYDANGPVLEIIIRGGMLFLVAPGEPHKQLIPYKTHLFRRRDYAGRTVEFVVENGKVLAIKLRTPAGEFKYGRIQPKVRR